MTGRPALRVGDTVEVELGTFVPGGHCLARLDGRVLFVRHGLPGELVRASVVSVSSKAAFADVVDVIRASAERVEPCCPLVGRCGGCDLQHASRTEALTLKAGIIADTLRRQGGLDAEAITSLDIAVTALDDDGRHWRTSARWHRAPDGRPGFRGWRDHEVIPVPTCPMLAPQLDSAMATSAAPVSSARLGSDGRVGVDGEATLQVVGHRRWTLSGESFWQAHRHAPRALVSSVLEHGRPTLGEHWADLYAGAGLFSAFLGEAVGPTGSVIAVESSPSAVRDAQVALADLPHVRITASDAGRWMPPAALDGVVLDPPRTGATPELLAALASARPGRIVYVSCDPVTFARDVRLLAGEYRLARLDAFDAFPMTHHVETVATLLPIGRPDKVS